MPSFGNSISKCFKNLENVLKEGGIHDDDNICLGNTIFTTMCITWNYHSNIYTDTDDVSYGFFIGLAIRVSMQFIIFIQKK